jgi:hypothetical protein
LGIDIDQLDLIDDPVAACEQAGAAICADFFHAGNTTMRALSE